MHAIEIEADVDENNELRIKLPEPHRGQHARVIVLLPSPAEAGAGKPGLRHRPSPRLANKGARIHGDDLAPAFSDEEWGDL
ncbi:hypothetical protein [Thiococcus pfennigii]|uniref:hypothetical protein n=1 Tax=Thiococcus pfennigii TaxID=1057 RepID=UPI001908453C|nr:hypothetical protein [Thiococcus pfennigii]MBK1702385.1 hypothetical protein [Thiococcus pfennigii]